MYALCILRVHVGEIGPGLQAVHHIRSGRVSLKHEFESWRRHHTVFGQVLFVGGGGKASGRRGIQRSLSFFCLKRDLRVQGKAFERWEALALLRHQDSEGGILVHTSASRHLPHMLSAGPVLAAIDFMCDLEVGRLWILGKKSKMRTKKWQNELVVLWAARCSGLRQPALLPLLKGNSSPLEAF